MEDKIDYTENVIEIEGGNHAQFGNYGPQEGDLPATISVEEQQALFRRLSPETRRVFREEQAELFNGLLRCFSVRPSRERTALFTNLCLSVMVLRRAVPDALPFLVPEAADAAMTIQIQTIVDLLDAMRQEDADLS